MKKVLIMFIIFSISNLSMATEELKVVPHVDLQSYLGTWYEIARFPNSFQKDCVGTTAEYSLRSDGIIKVVNRCHLKTLDGAIDEAVGKATVADKLSNAKLKVQFFWPFKGDYWIIDLGENYQYAVVSEPKRKFLWILSRTPQMESWQFQEITSRLLEHGFNLDKLIITPQEF